MRWDWYSATFQQEPEELLGVLVGPPEDLKSLKPGRGMYGYHRGVEVVRGDRKFAEVWWGGNGGGVHVVSSGAETPDTVELLREHFPEHEVTRADPCEDYTAPGAWDALSGLALSIADEHGIKVQHQGDWHRGVDGRTLYLGAPSSVIRLRVYEKGRQLQQDPDWVRVELQVRPKGDARAVLASSQPAELFGASRWSRELGERLSLGELARMRCGTVYRDSDVERTRHALVRQYGPALLAWATELGGAAALGPELVRRIEEAKRPLRRV